jgi:hypothetical protein
MGLNTTVLVLNDRLGDVEQDKEMGRLLALAIRSKMNDKQEPVGHGVFVIESHHADDTAVVLVGGNLARVLGYIPTSDPLSPDIGAHVAALPEVEKHYKPPAPEKPKKLSREEMNEFVKREYGYRLVKLVAKNQKVKITRKKVSG